MHLFSFHAMLYCAIFGDYSQMFFCDVYNHLVHVISFRMTKKTKLWIISSASVAVIAVVTVLAGVMIPMFFPNMNFKLGLVFSLEDKNMYGMVLAAHVDTGGGGGGGPAQNDNDAIHIHPKDLGEYFTIYAPISGKVKVRYGTIQNDIGGPRNHKVDISIYPNSGVDVHFSYEPYSNAPEDLKLMKQLMYAKNGKKVKQGDPLFKFVSVGSYAHVCFSVFTRTGKRYHPFDFMTDETKGHYENISMQKPFASWAPSGLAHHKVAF